MTWRSFVDFMVMLEMGQQDAIYRNYSLTPTDIQKPGIILDRAYARMGFDQKGTARAFVVPMVAAKLRDVGFRPPHPEVLAERMREWYQWDRLRTGEIRRGKYRPAPGNLSIL